MSIYFFLLSINFWVNYSDFRAEVFRNFEPPVTLFVSVYDSNEDKDAPHYERGGYDWELESENEKYLFEKCLDHPDLIIPGSSVRAAFIDCLNYELVFHDLIFLNFGWPGTIYREAVEVVEERKLHKYQK